MNLRRNINRGYQKLLVWQDAIEYYMCICKTYKNFSFELKKVASQQIACTDSVHRNIAEGYSRKSIKEYLSFLRIALASMAESVSGLHACRKAEQISPEEFESLDALAYKIENYLIRLIEELEKKRDTGVWIDSFVREETAVLNESEPVLDPSIHNSTNPPFQGPLHG